MIVYVSVQCGLFSRIEAAFVDPVESGENLANKNAHTIDNHLARDSDKEVNEGIPRLGQLKEDCVELCVETVWQEKAHREKKVRVH